MSKEKQIEEMIEIIASKICEAYSPTCDEYQPHNCGKCYANDTHISEVAEAVYNAGFRKRSEGNDMNEEEKLLKLIEEGENEYLRLVECGSVRSCDVKEYKKYIVSYLIEKGVTLSGPKTVASVAQPVTRRRVLENAIQCVCTDRNQQYGEPEDDFAVIASLWSNYAGREFTADDVAMMMALFNVGRIMTGTAKDDSYVDACGYLACAGEIAMREVSEE